MCEHGSLLSGLRAEMYRSPFLEQISVREYPVKQHGRTLMLTTMEGRWRLQIRYLTKCLRLNQDSKERRHVLLQHPKPRRHTNLRERFVRFEPSTVQTDSSRFRSEPEKLSVLLANALRSKPEDNVSSRKRIFKISSRSFSPGRSTSNRRGRRRRTASSKSNGRFVAPITMTLSSLDDFKPSISCMNSVMTPLCAIAPPLSRADMRAPNRASISSRKTTQGDNRRASENTALTSFSPSPTY